MLGDTRVVTEHSKALEEKGISIATVCPRQKTPVPQKTPPNRKIPPGLGDSPAGRDLTTLPLISVRGDSGFAAPKILVFHLRAAGEHKEEEITSKKFQTANENYLIR